MNCPKCNAIAQEGQTKCVNCDYIFSNKPYQKQHQKQQLRKNIAVVGVIIITMIILIATINYLFSPGCSCTDGIATPRAEIELSTLNNDYIISITGISKKIDINETTWEICYPNGTTLKRGETYNIYDFGKIGIKNFVGNVPKTGDWHYNDVNNSKGGYMKDDDGNNLTKPTDYWGIYSPHSQIVFSNNDEIAEPGAYKISAEDQYIVRGLENNGATPSKYIFKLIYDPADEQIANIVLE